MKPRHQPPVWIALMFAALPLAALAQTAAPAPLPPPVAIGPAVSASLPNSRADPRLMTPDEKRDSATPAGELRPERPVTPQVSIPLGKKAAALEAPAAPRPARNTQSGPAPRLGIDDAAARCEAQRGEQVRAKCRDELERQPLKR